MDSSKIYYYEISVNLPSYSFYVGQGSRSLCKYWLWYKPQRGWKFL